MDILNPDIEKYLLEVIPDRDTVLTEMEVYAASRNFPIVGPLVGRLLYVIAKATKARKVLELGSGFGYSAYWFAKAVGRGGRVVCTEKLQENEAKAMEFLKKGRVAERVKFFLGDALTSVTGVRGTFDIIFNDVDKTQYPQALKVALPKLKKGGLFISDNVLWSGRVLEKTPDAATAGILTFTRMLFSTKDLFTTIIPLRDGVSVSIKL